MLGIETSCDETSAAVVVDGRDVRSNVVASQVDLHAKYGGVVPEIASRAHIERLDSVIEEALNAAGVSRDDIDAVAVTNRPGLVGALIIGEVTAFGILFLPQWAILFSYAVMALVLVFRPQGLLARRGSA